MSHAAVPATPGLGVIAFAFTNTSWNGTPLPVDLGAIGMPGCQLRVEAQFQSLVLTNSGSWTCQLPIPNVASLLGAPFYNQAMLVDPQANNPMGAVMSNAMRGSVGLR